MCTPERTRLLQNDLRDAIAAFTDEDGDFVVAEDIRVFRRSAPTPMHHGESSVSYCAIGQGAKRVEFGDFNYVYGPDHILITTIEMPMVSQVVEATKEHPYLSMTLDLTPALVRSVINASNIASQTGTTDLCAHKVKPMETELLDATVRLMQSITRPDEADYMTPMIKREIVFRLLLTEHAGRMHQIAGMSVVSNQIKRALENMGNSISAPLRVSDLAEDVGMSVSSFHEHFKRVTGCSPLQYQKQLRLRQARNLLMAGSTDAAEAGYSVGYADASHFNRDYKKMFGLPPKRDVEEHLSSERLLHTSAS